MPTLIQQPIRLQAAGDPPKPIEEFIGRLNNAERRLSIARMVSPAGWSEPGQTPEFDEFTIVLSGRIEVEHVGGSFVAQAGQAIHTAPGEWVRYATPDGATYIAICMPAFSPDSVNRDAR